MSRKKLFKEDHRRLRGIVETTILLTNECADRSAEYYRRYQIEGHKQDLELSDQLHRVVVDLKALESRMGDGSPLDKALTERVAKEPGSIGLFFGKKSPHNEGTVEQVAS
jgi:hypothetical protein